MRNLNLKVFKFIKWCYFFFIFIYIMFIENEPGYLNCDLSIFYDNQNSSNIRVNENHLKYNKYVYFIHMANNNSNTETNTNKTFDDEIKNLASVGITMVDSFFKSAAPVAKKFTEKMTEIDDILKKPPSNTDNALQYLTNEDNDNLYYVLDLPRASKETCKIDINNNMLTVSATTEPPPINFEFLQNNNYEINLKVNFPVTKDCITARSINGTLYITIRKNNSNNININILD
jgi:HSP20 family molecular chaperone IbpA